MAEQQKLLLIDSRNRVSGKIENATFVLDRPIENFVCLRVNYVQIYNTFLNVTTKNNEWATHTVKLSSKIYDSAVGRGR